MPNPQYQAGARFERLVVERLGLLGWTAFRVAGSKGPADVVALRRGCASSGPPLEYAETLLIQCKRTSRPLRQPVDALSLEAKCTLRDLAEHCGAVPALAVQAPGWGVWIGRLDNGKEIWQG